MCIKFDYKNINVERFPPRKDNLINQEVVHCRFYSWTIHEWYAETKGSYSATLCH